MFSNKFGSGTTRRGPRPWLSPSRSRGVAVLPHLTAASGADVCDVLAVAAQRACVRVRHPFQAGTHRFRTGELFGHPRDLVLDLIKLQDQFALSLDGTPLLHELAGLRPRPSGFDFGEALRPASAA